jgi:hypothetical protein
MEQAQSTTSNLFVTRLFTLRPGDWAAMEMWPGYVEPSVPYFSPVRIESVKPLKTGQRQILIRFFNPGYAEGVQDFSLRLQVLARTRTHLIAQRRDHGCSDQIHCFAAMTTAWFLQFIFPRGVPPGSPYESCQTDEELIAKLRRVFPNV